MAAKDHHQHTPESPGRLVQCLSAQALHERLEEEINRARRHEKPLSCLLVRIENLLEMPSEPEGGLPEQTLAYVGDALGKILRSFDRVGRLSESELMIALPGAGSPQAEVVGRRMLERLRTIKVEADGERRPLRISMGLSAWHERLGVEDLLARSRAPLRPVNGDAANGPPAGPVPAGLDPPPAIRQP
jgi:PleD family two-component response regulator